MPYHASLISLIPWQQPTSKVWSRQLTGGTPCGQQIIDHRLGEVQIHGVRSPWKGDPFPGKVSVATETVFTGTPFHSTGASDLVSGQGPPQRIIGRCRPSEWGGCHTAKPNISGGTREIHCIPQIQG